MREVSGVGASAHVLTKNVLFDKMLVFSGYPETNSVHTNRELARSLGLPDAIGQGLQTYGYMCEWLVDYFGEDWYKGGRLIVSFLSLVVPGDTLYVKACEEETQEVDEGDHIVLAIWCENASGQKVAAGTASATIRHKG